MPIMVDGHNLVPKMPGLSLEDLDDEIQLIEMLQEFCRIRRVDLEVHFDKAPQGHPRLQHYGRVTARFARPGGTADDEIKDRLRRLERQARNWTVVSSDASIQLAARSARTRLLSSDEFARQVMAVLQGNATSKEEINEAPMSPDELEMWLKTFGGSKKGS